MDIIDGESVVSMTMSDDGKTVTFKNRSGEEVGVFEIHPNPIVEYEGLTKPAITSLDYGYKNPIVKGWSTPYSEPTQMPNPSTMPNHGFNLSWSPDGLYLAVGMTVSPWFAIYKRDGDKLTKLTAELSGADIPASRVSGLDWSPNGRLLIPQVTDDPDGHSWYPLVLSDDGSFTNASTFGPGIANANGIQFSPDGNYLAIVSTSSPYLKWYKIDYEFNISKTLLNPTDLPTGLVRDVAWSPDGQYLALFATTPEPVMIYKRAGDSLAKLKDAAALPKNRYPSTTYWGRWSPDGKYLAVVSGDIPGLLMYQQNGDVFTLLNDDNGFVPNLDQPGPFGQVYSVEWSPDAKYMAIGLDGYGAIVYHMGSTLAFEEMPTPSGWPGPVHGAALAWSPDGKHLAIQTHASPYFYWYKGAMAPLPGAVTRLFD
jgi:WD40 repeat protein